MSQTAMHDVVEDEMLMNSKFIFNVKSNFINEYYLLKVLLKLNHDEKP